MNSFSPVETRSFHFIPWHLFQFSKKKKGFFFLKKRTVFNEVQFQTGNLFETEALRSESSFHPGISADQNNDDPTVLRVAADHSVSLQTAAGT